jgi:hypothetical protein
LRLLQEEDSDLKLRWIRLAQRQPFIKIKHTPAYVRRREGMSGIVALAAAAGGAVPALTDLYERYPSDRCAIAVALAGIGPEARKAVPSLLRALDDSRTPDIEGWENVRFFLKIVAGWRSGGAGESPGRGWRFG